jgi:hypothetical protein
MTACTAILEDFFAKNFTNDQVDLGPINVCREKGLLLSFVYKFFWWPAGAISFLLSDILAQLDGPLSDVMFCLHSE